MVSFLAKVKIFKTMDYNKAFFLRSFYSTVEVAS